MQFSLTHRKPNEDWFPKNDCKCPRCFYYWCGFRDGIGMYTFEYKGYMVSYKTYPIQNRYSSEALIDNGHMKKWIYPERDFLLEKEATEHIIEIVKRSIDNYIEVASEI